jgi:hypothetical protein
VSARALGGGTGAEHIGEDGDGLTNFSTRDAQIYAEAIAAYGSAGDDFYISLPMAPCKSPDYLSLRYRGGPRDDLSDFWKVFDGVKAAHRANAFSGAERRAEGAQPAGSGVDPSKSADAAGGTPETSCGVREGVANP